MKLFFERFKAVLSLAASSRENWQRLSVPLLNAALSLTSFVMTVVNIFTGEYVLMLATLIFALCCMLNFTLIIKLNCPRRVISYVFCLESLALVGFFFVSGIPQGFSALWICLIPSFALMIFGLERGTYFSLIALAMIIFFFWTPIGRSLLLHDYGDTFMLRFPFFYIALFLIMAMFEIVRRETQRQLETAKNEYYFLYHHDALTGLYNRYGFNDYMRRGFDKTKVRKLSVILLDLDNFKKINDCYSHDAGDLVLKTVASILTETLCEDCHFCRWGGEEFLIIMECQHDALKMCELLRQKIEDTEISYGDHSIRITASLGVCIEHEPDVSRIPNMISRADAAMYLSKQNGKNRVTLAED